MKSKNEDFKNKRETTSSSCAHADPYESLVVEQQGFRNPSLYIRRPASPVNRDSSLLCMYRKHSDQSIHLHLLSMIRNIVWDFLCLNWANLRANYTDQLCKRAINNPCEFACLNWVQRRPSVSLFTNCFYLPCNSGQYFSESASFRPKCSGFVRRLLSCSDRPCASWFDRPRCSL